MTKKITAIVSLVIVGLLMITTLILANVSVNYSVNCATPSEVWVFTSSVWTSNSGRKANAEESEKIINLINSASKDRCLTALFNGTAFTKAEIVKEEKLKNITSPSSAGYNYFVCYQYNNEQALMNGKKKFKDEDGNYHFYKDLYFGIKNVDGKAVYDVFVTPWFGEDGNKNNSYNYLYKYQIKADYNELYNYLKDKAW